MLYALLERGKVAMSACASAWQQQFVCAALHCITGSLLYLLTHYADLACAECRNKRCTNLPDSLQ